MGEALEFQKPCFCWGTWHFGAFCFTMFIPEDSLRLMMFLVNPTTWTDMERILTQLHFVGDGKKTKRRNHEKVQKIWTLFGKNSGKDQLILVVFFNALKIQEMYFHTLWIHLPHGRKKLETFELCDRPTSFEQWWVVFFSSPWVFTRGSFPVKAGSWVTQGLGMRPRHRHGTSEVYALDLVWLVARLLVTGWCFFISNAAMEGTLPGEVHITTWCFLAKYNMQGLCWLHIGISRCFMLSTYSMLAGMGITSGFMMSHGLSTVYRMYLMTLYAYDSYLSTSRLFALKHNVPWNFAFKNPRESHDPTLKTPLETWTGLEPINITPLNRKMIFQNFMDFGFKIFIFGVI